MVKDAYGNGVFGKSASSVTVSELKSSKNGMKAQIMINEDSQDFKESGKDGIISVPVKIMCSSLTDRDLIYIKITITVDGNDLETDYIEVKGRKAPIRDPTYISLTSGAPVSTKYKLTEAVPLTYEIDTYSCNGLTDVSSMRGNGVNLELLPYYKVDGYAPLPKNFYIFKNSDIALSSTPPTITLSAGSVSVTTFSVDQSPRSYVML